MEALFSRIGLAASGLIALALILAVDVWLKPPREQPAGPSTSVFDMQLVTRDGRPVSSARWGVPLALSPTSVYTNLPSHTTGPYRINSLGLRGPEIEREPSGSRVISIGGSTAFGLLVGDAEDFGSVLARELDIEVLNGGVPGYLSMQELGLVVFDLLDLEPDLVIALDGWNDVYDAYWWERHGDKRGGNAVKRRATNVNFDFLENRLVDLHRVETSLPAALLQASRTLVRQSSLLSALARLQRPDPAVAASPSTDGPWLDGVVDSYVANLAKLRDVTAARDVALLVVLQPELGQLLPAEGIRALAEGPDADFIDGDAYWANVPPLYREFRKRAFRRLKEQGIAVVDATRSFRSERATPNWFRDPVHLSPAGHQALARQLRARVATALDDSSP